MKYHEKLVNEISIAASAGLIIPMPPKYLTLLNKKKNKKKNKIKKDYFLWYSKVTIEEFEYVQALEMKTKYQEQDINALKYKLELLELSVFSRYERKNDFMMMTLWQHIKYWWRNK